MFIIFIIIWSDFFLHFQFKSKQESLSSNFGWKSGVSTLLKGKELSLFELSRSATFITEMFNQYFEMLYLGKNKKGKRASD